MVSETTTPAMDDLRRRRYSPEHSQNLAQTNRFCPPMECPPDILRANAIVLVFIECRFRHHWRPPVALKALPKADVPIDFAITFAAEGNERASVPVAPKVPLNKMGWMAGAAVRLSPRRGSLFNALGGVTESRLSSAYVGGNQ